MKRFDVYNFQKKVFFSMYSKGKRSKVLIVESR